MITKPSALAALLAVALLGGCGDDGSAEADEFAAHLKAHPIAHVQIRNITGFRDDESGAPASVSATAVLHDGARLDSHALKAELRATLKNLCAWRPKRKDVQTRWTAARLGRQRHVALNCQASAGEHLAYWRAIARIPGLDQRRQFSPDDIRLRAAKDIVPAAHIYLPAADRWSKTQGGALFTPSTGVFISPTVEAVISSGLQHYALPLDPSLSAVAKLATLVPQGYLMSIQVPGRNCVSVNGAALVTCPEPPNELVGLLRKDALTDLSHDVATRAAVAALAAHSSPDPANPLFRMAAVVGARRAASVQTVADLREAHRVGELRDFNAR